MSFHKQTFHQRTDREKEKHLRPYADSSRKPTNSEFKAKLKEVFGNPNPTQPLEIQHTPEGSRYFQVITHSTNVAFQQGIDLEQLLLDYNVYVTGFGYTNKKGIIIHFMRW